MRPPTAPFARFVLLGLVCASLPGLAFGANPYVSKVGGKCPDRVIVIGTGAAATTSSEPRPEGVLTSCSQDSFSEYLAALIAEQSGTVLLVALAMIVFSGVQYMLSGINPDVQKQARQRIVGIIVGIVFYLSIQLIINQISSVSSIQTITN